MKIESINMPTYVYIIFVTTCDRIEPETLKKIHLNCNDTASNSSERMNIPSPGRGSIWLLRNEKSSLQKLIISSRGKMVLRLKPRMCNFVIISCFHLKYTYNHTVYWRKKR